MMKVQRDIAMVQQDDASFTGEIGGDVVAIDHGSKHSSSRFGAFITLTKPRLTLMSVLTSAAAYYIGKGGITDVPSLIHLIVGTCLVGGGCGALNMYVERDHDSNMKRTAGRPIPSGKVTPSEALTFGLVLSALGIVYLTFTANILTGILAVLTVTSYVLVYTPMKRRSTMNTLIGALPGALPPAIGWCAATGSMNVAGWVLFGILFLWQMPHFLSFAWMYRNDYRRAGYVMTATVDESGKSTGLQTLLYTIALVAVSIAPSFIGLAGNVYLYSASFLGLVFLVLSSFLILRRRNGDARAMFLYSLIYLPVLLTVLLFDVK